MSASFDLGAVMLLGTRERQEDAFYLGDADGSPRPIEALREILAVVADGLGGQTAGDVASEIAVATFAATVANAHRTDPAMSHEAILRNAVDTANDTLRSRITVDAALQGMATTLVAAWVESSRLHWLSIGDSHLYRCQAGALTHLNERHRVVPQSGADAQANVLTSCLSGASIAAIDAAEAGLPLAAGDWVMLASDGLDCLDDHSIGDSLAGAQSAQSGAESLAALIVNLAAEDQDNTTILVIRILEPT